MQVVRIPDGQAQLRRAGCAPIISSMSGIQVQRKETTVGNDKHTAIALKDKHFYVGIDVNRRTAMWALYNANARA